MSSPVDEPVFPRRVTPTPLPEPNPIYFSDQDYPSNGSGSSDRPDLMQESINIQAPCIYNGPSRVYQEEEEEEEKSKPQKQKPKCPPNPKVQGMRLRGGCHNKYYELTDIKPQRVAKRAQTSRVMDMDGKTYEQYGCISRGEELALLLRSGKSDYRPPDSRHTPPVLPPSTCQANKTLDEPKFNSSRFEAKAIQMRIADLSKVPYEVERVVRSEVNENSKGGKQLYKEATKKLNIQPATKVYKDLLEIGALPEVSLKRIPPKEKKPDPVPVLEDYMQVQFNRVKPYSVAHLMKRDEFPVPEFNDDNANDYDIINLERMFISQS